MRCALFVVCAALYAGAALFVSGAYAQSGTLPAPAPPAPPTFAAPPSTLAVPNARSIAAATAARGNIARWRNSERRRLGVFVRGQPDGSTADRGAIPEVGGYFMAVNDVAPLRAGAIGYGTWRDRGSAMEQPSSVTLTLAEGAARCGATQATIDVANVVYLGPALDPQWSAVAREIGAAAPDAADFTVAWSEFNVGVSDRDRLIGAWPQRAMEREVTGVAHLACAIGSAGELSCGATGEEPTGWGFDAAGTVVASAMRVASLTKRGEASAGACTAVDIVFGITNDGAPTIRARAPAS